MQKKLQVFISSTFTDLEEERQTAVQAVLNAGHIPAGMELFKAADTSQKETIKKWIEESDIYMLILGGRYGSIDEETGKSYTHWEYDYAKQLGKPRFAIIIHEKALEQKVMKLGFDVTERNNPVKYKDFRFVVLDKISKFYSDLKDIKIAVLESLKEYEKDEKLTGWVSRAEIKDVSSIMKDNENLLKENTKLQKQLQQLQIKQDKEKSMSRKGNCWDSAYIESFFSHFKSECFHLYSFHTADEVKFAARKYIHFYNHQRFQKKLNNLSPYKYRTQVA
ncbi:hypothetical protein B7492_31640 (plasmid) [Bacillus mycoides]|uniref:Integrase catalytic domain-containing protein n=1 Tax=Bacillus mycoides TaxID=1405 RepID=A0A1W6AIA3_BACMY|nr:DUF4062 domain-containing protein [Bacillus mycoides]ARJ25588.1 hypothetical protein B7492_31640 [Bacillus mycoides]